MIRPKELINPIKASILRHSSLIAFGDVFKECDLSSFTPTDDTSKITTVIVVEKDTQWSCFTVEIYWRRLLKIALTRSSQLRLIISVCSVCSFVKSLGERSVSGAKIFVEVIRTEVGTN